MPMYATYSININMIVQIFININRDIGKRPPPVTMRTPINMKLRKRLPLAIRHKRKLHAREKRASIEQQLS